MKVLNRYVRLDTLSATQGDRSIRVSAHGHTITLSAGVGKEQVVCHEFTFDQFHRLLRNLKPGIAELCDPN